jgi:small-conductance mechanosensitive channel
MDSLTDQLARIPHEWPSGPTLVGLGALLLAACAARVAHGFAAGAPPRGGRLARALGVALPYAATALVLVAARAALGLAGLPPQVPDLALLLFAALCAIGAATGLVSLTLGPHNPLRAWEVRVAVFAWLFVAMHLLGWLGSVIAFLDGIAVTPAHNGESGLTLWSLLRALFTVIAFVIASAWIGRALERRIAALQGLAAGTRLAVAKFAYAFLIAFGVLLGLSASGVNLGALSIFGGALGLGLGFGLQAIAANFVSGFVLLMDKSIKPGDVISFTGTIGTSTEGFGWVQELRGRYVVVRDRDGVETLVPNQNLITNQVINWSYSDKRVRLKLPVRVSYEDDPEFAMQVLLRAAQCSPRILRDPPPVARLMGFHDYGLDLELRFWIADPEDGVNNVRSDVNRAIWRLFRAEGIRIPRAQLDVRMIDADGRVVGTGTLPARMPPVAAPAAGDGEPEPRTPRGRGRGNDAT